MGERRGFVMARSFKIVDMKGDENEEAVHFFDQSWFKRLMRYALDSIYWGHSLIELGDLCTDGDGCICYSDVKLIPRKHVIPEYGRVITDLGQDWTTGIDYRQPPFSDWLIEAGRPDDLGLYLKAASQTIPKKNMLAFWDTFGEIFGMPMRIARTTSRDQKEIDRLDKMLREAEPPSPWWQEWKPKSNLWKAARGTHSMSMTSVSIGPTPNCQSLSSGRR